ncbi:chromatin-remodeling complex subunit ies6 [Cryptotrichosporon argae]
MPPRSRQPLAERLSFAELPRPFKNPAFTSRLALRTGTAAKKNAKQILTLERERVSGGDGFLSAAQVAAVARGEGIDGAKKRKPTGGDGKFKKKRKVEVEPEVEDGAGAGADDEDGQAEQEQEQEDEAAEEKKEEDVKVFVPTKEIITYHTPTAPPSLLPAKKYCDITGLHAAYTDPRSKLRYHGLGVWHVVRQLGPGVDQQYLAIRGAQTALK